ncbi:ubiquitin carboxyl-terminal hydrolase 38 [Drosophila nasuta]|uniref:ubiquitin carboxyl-terminal hydrolase 38 n=1 Tax=Drosophila nasuta TaxID=42062 RepID=UPI00295F1ECB|nr:ubiquitin carboxyl-terminal hydrolase 38 [Drosophila nasuta]
MAVKQNLTESNDVAATGAAAGQTTGSTTTTATTTSSGSTANSVASTSGKTANNICDEGGGGGGHSASGELSLPHAREGVEHQGSEVVIKIKKLLESLQHTRHKDQRGLLQCYVAVIQQLAHIPISNTPEDLKLFKEEITKVGKILAMHNSKELLMCYLHIVYPIISDAKATPSCAVAIVFELFHKDLILEAVQLLLGRNPQCEQIRKTVNTLCKWLGECSFCQNLKLWILALLQGLRDQEKYLLLDQIAMDNIEMLFIRMLMPALRPQVAPIVFHMLSTINHAPEIFHKILPMIPKVINALKKQVNIVAKTSTDTYIQELVDLFNALMLRFADNDELYAPLKEVLRMYEPSQNSFVLARDMLEQVLPRNARVGLVNLGNTCYMNSVLQALAMTSDFVRQILLIESNSLLLLKMQQQLALMHHSMRFELTPSLVLKATRPPGFTPGLQHDSSEFLGYLLDLLHEHEINAHSAHINTESAQVKALKESSATETPSSDDIVAAGVIPYNSKDFELCSRPVAPAINCHSATPTNVQSKKPPSTIDKTFAGKLSTTYKCLSCAWESRNEDSFRELQLSFPDDKDDCGANNYSVQDLIDYYCSAEKLDGDNQYFCPSCKKLCDAERRIGFTQPPRNLILTLKQFKYDQKYHFRTKLMHKVFHDESVVVKVCGNDSLQETCSVHYDLYAGVVHAGYSMDSGHYFTFAADQSKNWFKFNDSLVTNSQPQEMHNLTSPNTPYILFYQMCGRSSEVSDNGPLIPMVPVPMVPPLKLDELPRTLRDYVKQDNREYTEELKLLHFKRNVKRNNVSDNGTMTRNGYEGDDEDDQSPPPTGGCGGNDLGMNINRFVY